MSATCRIKPDLLIRSKHQFKRKYLLSGLENTLNTPKPSPPPDSRTDYNILRTNLDSLTQDQDHETVETTITASKRIHLGN